MYKMYYKSLGLVRFQQGFIKLIKSDSKYIHNVTNDFYFK